MGKREGIIGVGGMFIIIGALVLFARTPAAAHCDTLDGPVVATARAALEKGDVTPVLKWVMSGHESEIREAFAHTLAVRQLSPEAKELADMYFFETLVRVHRAGEGAPYTGLKPAGELEPPIAAADKAIETGSIEGLIEHVKLEVDENIRIRFERVVETKKHADESVEDGREFVEAYVIFVHYIESLHNTLRAESAHGGEAESGGHSH